jgi:membrane dipeptidase
MIRSSLVLSCWFALASAAAPPASPSSAPAAAPGSPAADDVALLRAARALAREAVVVDTHIDVPYRLQEGWADLSVAAPSGDFDHPRAVAGGLDVAFMSIYTPPELEQAGGGRELAHRLIDHVEALVGRAPARFALVHSPAEVARLARHGRILLALGMENGSPIEGKLENLRAFHARGVRYVTLAHGKSNHLADSSCDDKRPWDGLSPFGLEVVREMNRLGMMIDVSHLSDAAVRDVLAASTAPVIASHSSARRFTPGWERNLDDASIRAIAAGGGVVQVNFGSAFLTADALAWTRAEQAATKAHLEANGFEPDGDAAAEFERAYRAQHPYPFATVAHVADHIEHVVAIAGIDHVGIGSDFDGVGDSLPRGLKSVADYPNLVAELMRRGHREQALRKLLGGNALRVWSEVERRAGNAGR